MGAYEVLGIATTASREQIAAAYREQVKRCHPDVGGDAATFKLVQHAYEQLAIDASAEKARSTAPGKSSGAAAGPPAGFQTASSRANHGATKARPANATGNSRDTVRSKQAVPPNAAVDQVEQTRLLQFSLGRLLGAVSLVGVGLAMLTLGFSAHWLPDAARVCAFYCGWASFGASVGVLFRNPLPSATICGLLSGTYGTVVMISIWGRAVYSWFPNR